MLSLSMLSLSMHNHTMLRLHTMHNNNNQGTKNSLQDRAMLRFRSHNKK